MIAEDTLNRSAHVHLITKSSVGPVQHKTNLSCLTPIAVPFGIIIATSSRDLPCLQYTRCSCVAIRGVLEDTPYESRRPSAITALRYGNSQVRATEHFPSLRLPIP